jgi:hypothetical protein
MLRAYCSLSNCSLVLKVVPKVLFHPHFTYTDTLKLRQLPRSQNRKMVYQNIKLTVYVALPFNFIFLDTGVM